jgi:hypothetical protein
MTPLERAARLRREADLVLQEIQLFEALQPCGRIAPTGSYYLDVMAYPDIDISVSLTSIAQVFQIGARIASCPRVIEVVFQRSKDQNLPDGLYLKPRVEYGDWGRPWKIDIWFLREATIDAALANMGRFRDRMTPELREQIVGFKCSVLTADHRTPMYSGYYIYKAFIDEGMRDWGEVRRYLASNGIRMP